MTDPHPKSEGRIDHSRPPGTGPLLAFPSSHELPDGTLPRCLRCGYVLKGLETPVCPECGRVFDPANTKTYGLKPPFLRWRYWTPALLESGIGGFVIFMVLVTQGSYGFGLTFALPFAIGAILGYGTRAFEVIAIILGGLLAVIVPIMSVLGGRHGLGCGVVLIVIFVAPILGGLFSGWVLRWILKRTRFNQRAYLPVIAMLLTPLGVATVERWIGFDAGVETISTSRVLPVPADRAWEHLMFYEEVNHAPPWQTRIGLPQPLYTRGAAAEVGDVKTCVYDKGRLVKRVTKVQQGHYLGFEVIEQVGLEDHSVRLVGGEFRFDPLTPNATRVTLTTEYEPLLQARVIWRPFERHLCRALHQCVLEGIELETAEDRQLAVAQPQAGEAGQ